MSRIERILIALINGTSYDEPRLSRVEDILYSFLDGSTYDRDPESRIEDLLIALKESGLYDDATLSRIEEILYCKLNSTEYDGWIGSRVEQLLVLWNPSSEEPINTNPDPTRYIPIELLAEHFNKDFTGGDYWYFSLFYETNGVKATNFFYWAKEGSTVTDDKEVIYTSGDAYDYYNTSSAPNVFSYDVGHDTVPYRFTFDMDTMVATLYNQDNTVRWTSPTCVGIETNVLTTEPTRKVKIYVTSDDKIYVTYDNKIYKLRR